MKTTVKYILAAALAAAAVLPVSGASAMSAEQEDSTDVYTIEQCYDLVRQNYPLVKRYELLDLTEEYTLKNAYRKHSALKFIHLLSESNAIRERMHKWFE